MAARTIDIQVTPASDLVVKVIEPTDSGSRMANLHVSKAMLMQKSDYFRAMFSSEWADSTNAAITINDFSIKSIELWLKLVHKTPADFSKFVSVQDVWFAIKAYDYYGFEKNTLGIWLRSYYAELDQDKFTSAAFLSQLLLPFYFLGNEKGFQHLTKAIVYRTVDRISDEFPELEDRVNLPVHIDMPHRVIQQLVSARRRLQDVLHTGLLGNPRCRQRAAACKFTKQTADRYVEELRRIGVAKPRHMSVFGSELKDDISVSEMLNRLGSFRLAEVTPTGHDIAECNGCMAYFTIVSEVRHRVAKYFHGLCLDCMRESKAETKKAWADCCARPSEDCQVDHGYPTRHYSFMGPWNS